MYRVERTRLHPFCTTPKCDRTMCYLFHVQQHYRSSSASPPQLWRPRSSEPKDISNEACCSSQSAPVSYSRETNNDSSRKGSIKDVYCTMQIQPIVVNETTKFFVNYFLFVSFRRYS
uniref:C3H1-type domain-containing protein n=1 Tax=Ascaris lumbricoides TaxID=6252 RepID=A0A0M3ILL1_ASCLU